MSVQLSTIITGMSDDIERISSFKATSLHIIGMLINVYRISLVFKLRHLTVIMALLLQLTINEIDQVYL